MKQQLIARYREWRSVRQLRDVCLTPVALVGIGNHTVSNLLPALLHLGVPIRWIACKSPRKVPLIEKRYGIKATTNLDDVLSDAQVAGVIVSASPQAHFTLSSLVLNAGKSLLVEKPACGTARELQQLHEIAQAHHVNVAMMGLQKRYSPLISTLRKKLLQCKASTYSLRYLTGAYPEGEALSQLFIHPLDLVCHLWGKAQVISKTVVECGKGQETWQLILQHQQVTGMLELSTAYSWQNAHECLCINTKQGVLELNQMQELTFTPKSRMVLGIPLEKVIPSPNTTATLAARNNFVPTAENNQPVTQGFLPEMQQFTAALCNKQEKPLSSLDQILPTMNLIDQLREL